MSVKAATPPIKPRLQPCGGLIPVCPARSVAPSRRAQIGRANAAFFIRKSTFCKGYSTFFAVLRILCGIVDNRWKFPQPTFLTAVGKTLQLLPGQPHEAYLLMWYN